MKRPTILAIACALLAGGLLGSAHADPDRPAVRLVIERADGSSLCGTAAPRDLALRTSFGRIDVPLEQVRSLRHDPAAEILRLRFRNGDVLTGAPEFAAFALTTPAGPATVPLNEVRGASVSPPYSGLVLHYSFDEEGARVVDRSGAGNHGTLHGATWSAEGKLGGGCRFDGEDDYVDGGAGASLELTRMTVLAWVRADRDAPPDTCAWVVKGEIGGRGLDYGLQLYKAHSVWFYAGCAERYAGRACGDRRGEWVHVAATYDGAGTARLFVDGRPLADLSRSDPGPAAVPERGYSLKIGRWSGQTFRGLMDEVMIFDRVLPDREIAAIHDDQR